MNFSDINFLAVFVAAIAGFAFGALWYSKALFGKIWQKELGFTEEKLKEVNDGETIWNQLCPNFYYVAGISSVFSGT